MRKKIMLCLVFLGTFLLMSCDHHDKKNETKKTSIIVAKLTKPTEKLYYTGILSPLKTVPVVSPVDGNFSRAILRTVSQCIKGSSCLSFSQKRCLIRIENQ